KIRQSMDEMEDEIHSVNAPVSSAQIWHSDGSMTLTPTAISLLRGVDLPEVGGDTMFANMYLAYETLSEGMQKLISALDGVYVRTRGRAQSGAHAHAPPLVRAHPKTGRKSLYVSAKVHPLAGLTIEESGPLIRFLCAHAARPQFCYRHCWQNNDLLV